jgi:hypothetical protein
MRSNDSNNRCEWGYILDDDSKEFGLTLDEYQILVEDYEQAIEEGNRKYGYGGAGYIDSDGNYHLPEYNDNYVDHISNQSQKQIQIQRKKRRAKSKESVEEVAIARGIIKILRPEVEVKI